MRGKHWIGMLLLIASLGVSVWVGLPIGRSVPGGSVDLQVIYYGTKCLLQRHDPYTLEELRSEYISARKGAAATSTESPELVAVYIYLPPAFLAVAPLAVLPWPVAQMLWMAVLLGALFAAGVLMAQAGSRDASRLALFLACLVLANCEIGVALANSAVLVVSLCAIVTWCFLRQRGVSLAIILLALALAIKPHDAILVCFYFLLAGSVYRRSAMKALVLVGIVGLTAALWVGRIAPHWPQEWRANMAAEAAPGGISDPSLNASKGRTAGQVIDLQAALSVLEDNASFYNPAAYAICCGLTVIWVLTTVRAKFSETKAWLAMATIVPLSLLPTYHRPYDAKLLLLAIPACAMLWRAGGWRGWVAVAVTTTTIVLTADIPLSLISNATESVDISRMGLLERVGMIPVVRPVPLALLAMAVFYLWVYARAVRGSSELQGPLIHGA